MRLLRLDLLRYGHLADVRLDFPREARLHVVLGPNEAGKSTALAAIGDALFGFEHRTDYAFLFDTAQLRLGFEVEAADGTREAFLRRKGNRNTLLDPAEQPVPEAALTRLLGGARRELFRTTYGLNGETLRKGALALLASGGEAGESLLAGMGLQNLRGALGRLDEQAKALAGSRKHNQALVVALDAWKRARAAAEEAAIRPRDWSEAQAELQAVHAGLAEARAEAAALRQEESRLRRAILVRPILAQLEEQRRELEALGGMPELPPDAAARLDQLHAVLRQAEEDVRRETAEAERLEAETAALGQDQAVLDVQDEVDALSEQRGMVVEALRDLPEVERHVEAYRARVAEAASLLGTGAAPEAIRDAVPKPAMRQKAQRLIIRQAELAAAHATSAAALQDAERRREAAAARLAASTSPPPSGPLRRALAAARAEGPLDRELAAAERKLAETQRHVAAALASLPLWSGDAAALASLALPLEPMAEAASERLGAATAALQAARGAAAEIETERSRLQGELVQLARGGTVPTPEVIAAARSERDAAWRLLRTQIEGRTHAGPGMADRFEALRDAADRLADARADDAGRVTAYAERQARLGWLGEEAGRAAEAVLRESARLAEAEAAWASLWAPTGIVPQAPAAMQAWRRQREEALRLAAQETEARQRRDDVAERRDAARERIRAVLPEAAATTLAALLDEAEEAAASREAEEHAQAELAAAVAREAAQAQAARHALEESRAELQALGAPWGEAMVGLGLDPEASVEAAEAALEAWGRIAEAATAWRGDAGRVADMRAAVARFEAVTRDLLARLGETAGEEPATLCAARFARRLATARDRARDAAALARQARERRAAAARAAECRAEALRSLDALRAQALADDLPALEDTIRRAARRATLVARGAGLAEDLMRQGDGLAEPQLRAEATAVDPDAARARLEEIEAGEGARHERLTTLGARQQTVASRLAAMEAGRDAAMHAQEARQHLAAAQDAAERFARLHVARTLLQAGIERLRAERQGPLLMAAGRHLAMLTQGRYPRLEADENDAGQVLLRAVRMDGTTCPVEALSEGTRDQLYLSLRVAALELHAAGAEPLPFIADDLLATFDDTRSAAALELLAKLGERVQAILFTHHRHVADLAKTLTGVSVQVLPDAPASAGRP